MRNKSIAIITARGGSKRIPRKNIKEFCGKPIIQYSIEAALASNMFNEVMVSTDDEEIKDIALKFGASVPFMRKKNTSNDMAMTYEVLLEVLGEYKKSGQEFEYMCCIYPTAPFITEKKIKDSMNKLIQTNADTVIPIVPFSFPPQRGFIINNENVVNFKWPENSLVRSQDLEKMYHDCGQFYCINVNRFLKEKSIIMKKSVSVIMSELEVQDIDNLEDWKIAEFKYKLMYENNFKVIT